MTKRKTGSTRRPKASAKLTRKQHSRLERERKLQRILIGSAIAVAVAVVGVVAYGLITEYVIKASSPVATVGDTPIKTSEFQSRVRFLRANMALQLQQWQEERRTIDPTSDTADLVLDYIDQNIGQLEDTLAEENKTFIGNQALDQLIRHEIVRQEAARRGILLDSDEVQRKIEMDFGYDRLAQDLPLADSEPITQDVEAAPTAVPVTEVSFLEQYEFFLKDILKPLGISENLYRSWTEAELLEVQLRERFGQAVPLEAEQLAFRLIVVGDLERAAELADRMESGEAFQTLVDEIEGDEEGADYVQDVDWLPRAQIEESFGVDVASQLWDLEVAATAGPIPSVDGASQYVVEITGHEVRAVDDRLRDRLIGSEFEAWLSGQRDALVEVGEYEDLTPSDP